MASNTRRHEIDYEYRVENPSMKPLSEIRLQCDKPAEVMDAVKAITPVLENQYCLKLADVVLGYLQTYGFKETYDRVNGKTVATIFEEAAAGSQQAMVDEGCVEGVKYTLYETNDAAECREDQ
ncbi:hypothetical protein NG895_19840 [Aeoliella sp. ICT_H6.2]|uniref:Uncharacterized protein n=1 Tax=Aeoliella straminimaris TaxID=2954799 RepID=A0A9X2FDE3_9BACT|nr:hypothetical protein [Aeoliella straminimaris]MCO6046158.1 hypothetical protein [Aeoliella straminimaris]